MTTVSNVHHASKPRLNTLLVTARARRRHDVPARTRVVFCSAASCGGYVRPRTRARRRQRPAERAAEYAVAVAERYDADLHLLFVIDERLHQDIDSGDVSATAIAEEHQAFTESIRDRFRDAHDGVFETSSATAFSRHDSATPGSVVLDVAEDLDADFIVVPARKEAKRPSGARRSTSSSTLAAGPRRRFGWSSPTRSSRRRSSRSRRSGRGRPPRGSTARP